MGVTGARGWCLLHPDAMAASFSSVLGGQQASPTLCGGTVAADADLVLGAALQEFVAATLSQHQILKAENMRAAFMHFDTDNSGTISKDELREALKVWGQARGGGDGGAGCDVVVQREWGGVWMRGLQQRKVFPNRACLHVAPHASLARSRASRAAAAAWTLRSSASWPRWTRMATERSITRCGWAGGE